MEAVTQCDHTGMMPHRSPSRVPKGSSALSDWRFILLALVATRLGLGAVGLVPMQFIPRGASYLDLAPRMPVAIDVVAMGCRAARYFSGNWLA